MPKRRVVIQYDKCMPEVCDPNEGICAAVAACPKDILVQEDPGEPPMITFWDLCQGCGECLEACPCDAISLH
ncbi:MAG: 4Fe-4S binding protein [Armatimonadota bacterium]